MGSNLVDNLFKLDAPTKSLANKLDELAAPKEEIREIDRTDQLIAGSEDRTEKLIKDFQRTKVRDFSLSFNRRFAEAMDIPGHAVAGVGNLLLDELTFGLDDKTPFEIPSGGFTSLFEETGATVPEEELADNLPSEIGKFFGEQAAGIFALRGLKGIKPGDSSTVLGKSQNAIRGLSRSQFATSRKFKKFFGNNTIAPGFLANEAFAGLGAATAGFVVQEKFPDSPVGKFFGQVAGGITTQVLPARVLIKGGAELARRAKIPFQESAATGRARARLQRDLQDPKTALENLRNPGVSPEFAKAATPAQLAQDPQLLRLEQSILKSGDTLTSADQLAAESQTQIGNLNHIVIQALENQGGDIKYTKQTLQERQQYLSTLIDGRRKQVQDAAAKEIEEIGEKTITQARATQVVNKHLSEMVDDLDATEKQLWDVVPLETPADGTAVVSEWQKLLSRQTEELSISDLMLKDDAGNDDLFKLLGKLDKNGKFIPGSWGKKELKLENLQNLRSRVLQSIRTIRKEGGSARRIANLEQIDQALLHSMGAVPAHVDTAAGQNLRIALDFTREKNKLTRSGIVGDLLKVDKQGRTRIPEEVTLDKILVGQGRKANSNLKKILEPFEFAKKARAEQKAKFVEEGAFREGLTPDQLTTAERQGLEAGFDLEFPVESDSGELLDAFDHYITGEFLDKHTVDGAVKTASAKNFLVKNKELLDNFPQIRTKIEKAIELENTSSLITKQSESAARRLNNPNISIAALWMNSGHTAVYDDILKASGDNLNQKITTLMSKISRDESGKATAGAQAAFFDWLRKRATIADKSKNLSSESVFGEKFLSGSEFKRLMGTEQVQKLAGRLLTEEQQNRIAILANEMDIIQRARAAQASSEPVVIDTPGALRTVFAKVAGVRAGTKVAKLTGSGGIQMQAIFSKLSSDTLKKNFKDPAGKLLHDAILGKDKKLLELLLMPIDSVKTQKFVKSGLNVWLTTALYQLGEKSVDEIETKILDITDSMNGLINIEDEIK